jgi:hypothetical protein
MPLRLLVGLLLLIWCAMSADAQPLPRPDHVVIVFEENKSFAQVIGNPGAPYINRLAGGGALFTRSYGVAHPSQPNYLALFSGDTHGVSNDACPLDLSGGNLADALTGKGLSFAVYAESMPQPGFAGCVYRAYYRKHNPVANWRGLAALNRPFSDFPQQFAKLSTVALVIPDQRNDMHDGSVAQGDAWLAKNIGPYVKWAMSHNSLLVVTWDEDDGSADNQIATLFAGPMIKSGRYGQRIDHYNILRTIEEMLGLDYLGNSATAKPVDGVWQKSGAQKN